MYFALQVRFGKEARYIEIARFNSAKAILTWPRRRLRIRQAGQWRDALAPLFPGYLFLKANRVEDVLWHELRSLSNFIKFLPSNDRIVPLDTRDQATLSHFLAFGEVVDNSLITFDEYRRVRVVNGPLQGLEGQIVKVDRRKGSAKVRLDIYKDAFEIDFGFEVIERTLETIGTT